MRRLAELATTPREMLERRRGRVSAPGRGRRRERLGERQPITVAEQRGQRSTGSDLDHGQRSPDASQRRLDRL